MYSRHQIVRRCALQLIAQSTAKIIVIIATSRWEIEFHHGMEHLLGFDGVLEPRRLANVPDDLVRAADPFMQFDSNS
ncbi:hypothetical protein NPX13_g5624 [Xylaria arbuscula]|uniref:Uncharacterized protein n=1 Tax=Xylaria arbuscula TaxID=114810 RepID=A0A9W8TKU3_9PEZI|nr:hypothetical protein NPX13_g5624 [Xylaria arbuscula]